MPSYWLAIIEGVRKEVPFMRQFKVVNEKMVEISPKVEISFETFAYKKRGRWLKQLSDLLLGTKLAS